MLSEVSEPFVGSQCRNLKPPQLEGGCLIIMELNFKPNLKLHQLQIETIKQNFGKLAVDSKSTRLSHDRYARSRSRGGSLAKWTCGKNKKVKQVQDNLKLDN